MFVEHLIIVGNCHDKENQMFVEHQINIGIIIEFISKI